MGGSDEPEPSTTFSFLRAPRFQQHLRPTDQFVWVKAQHVGDVEDRPQVRTPFRELELRHVGTVEGCFVLEVGLLQAKFDSTLADDHGERLYRCLGDTVW